MTNLTSSSPRTARTNDRLNFPLELFQWIIIALSFLWTLVSPYIWNGPSVIILFMLALPFTVIHAMRYYGASTTAFFVASIYLISNAYENLSVMTGFPFGHYHYTGSYQIFHIPFWIGIFYISIGYLSWRTASTLLGNNPATRGFAGGAPYRIHNLSHLDMGARRCFFRHAIDQLSGLVADNLHLFSNLCTPST
jgi:Carotenoid biosynthesis protein